MGRIPRPFPDKEKLRYKLKCFESPATSVDGTAQPLNDFMLRAQIKKILQWRKVEQSERNYNRFHSLWFLRS